MNFVYTNENCDPNPPNDCALDGESIQVDVFEINTTSGLPDVMVASTEAHVVPVGTAAGTSVDVNFASPLNLMPGQYVFAVTEPVRTVSTFDTINVQIATTSDRFTTGAGWVDWPTNPNAQWSNNEDFGFNVTYMIRPLLLDTDLIFRNGFE